MSLQTRIKHIEKRMQPLLMPQPYLFILSEDEGGPIVLYGEEGRKRSEEAANDPEFLSIAVEMDWRRI